MKNLLLILLAILTGNVGAQNISDEATISVITCGPNQDALYSAFGHSALRVQDPRTGIDYAFNYGIFDFNDPNFYLNFAKGNNLYMLGVYDYQHFQQSYIAHNQFLREQVLNLTRTQKQKVYNYLLWNAKPENVYYRYDYFYDNCATRIRDVFIKALGDEVKFDGAYVTTDYSIRDLTDLYLTQQPWGDLGIDIGLGLPMDKKASAFEYMFLPAYIESGFDHAMITNDSATVPLVKEKNIIYESREEAVKGLPHPLYVFSALAFLALVLCGRDYKKQNLSTWFDATLFGITGCVGLLLVLLWFFTDHKAAANNFNLLWALPTHLIAVFAMIKKPSWLKSYFLITVLIQVGLLASWWLLPQKMNTALIPLVVALLLRAYIQYILRKRRAV